MTKGFLKAGHAPTLVAALLYFDVSFMAWVLLGPMAPFLRDELGLTATGQGLLTAIPLLGGSLFRPILGAVADRIGGRRTGLIGMVLTLAPLLAGWQFAHTALHFYVIGFFLGIAGAGFGVADRIGGRRTGLIGMVLTLAPLVAGWQFAHTALHFYVIGFFLGIAGASFAVALPLASRWYPAEYQGLAMGIAGAGNSGTLLATLFVPRLAEHYGWAMAFGLAMLPVAAVFVVFALLAKDSPAPRPVTTLRDYRAILREPDTLWLAFLYSLTFGGFVGFASFLTTFFHEQYQLSRVAAGDFTTVVVIAGSLLRPVGGWLSDRMGGYRLLVLLLAGFALCLGGVASMPPVAVAVALLFLGMGMLGMGNGAVFQLVPQRFPDRMGIVTGLVGAAGGLGGFFLPTLLGAARDLTGSYASGLLLFAGVFAVGTVVLLELGARWNGRWHRAAVERSGVFCYRTALRALAGERAA